MKQFLPEIPNSSQVVLTLPPLAVEDLRESRLGIILATCRAFGPIVPWDFFFQYQPTLVLPQEFLCIMDQIRLHMEATVKQAGWCGPLDFSLDDFRDLFKDVPFGEGRLAVHRLLPVWYGSVYIRTLYLERQWRDCYEDTTLLTREQEVAYFAAMRSTDPYIAARWRDLFIHRNGGLVGSWAKHYRGKLWQLKSWNERNQDQPTELDLLLRAGNEGLEKAVDRFDPSLGHKFSTYASYYINGAMTKLFKDLKADLQEQALVGPAVVEEGPRIATDYLELWDEMHQALDRLNDPRKSQIITLHCGLFGSKAETLTTIGQSLGISPQRVRAIRERAMTELKTDRDLRRFYRKWFWY
jgi:RNA polymerase sigma factor (sigma-70 family)